ncbi:hypothetical protein DFH27DRAFT_607857 [Peziza echinospora]|nr:hypothetical protein DFH27DRAFT_607857 [Peziza echinospora]
MPFTTRRRGASTTVVPARKPTLFNRIVHPAETPASHSKRNRATHRRSKATGPAPVSTHRRARSRPTIGARIHGMAKRVLGTVKGDRSKKNAGKAMMNGVGPGTRKSTAPRY